MEYFVASRKGQEVLTNISGSRCETAVAIAQKDDAIGSGTIGVELAMSRTRDIRNELDHPVIDGDAHRLDVGPAVIDFLEAMNPASFEGTTVEDTVAAELR